MSKTTKTGKHPLNNEKPVKRAEKKAQSHSGLVTKLQSLLALVLLAGLAFEGTRSLLESTPEAVQVGLAALVVLMLVQVALRK